MKSLSKMLLLAGVTISCITLTSCATKATLSDEGRSVKLATSDPAENCTEIGYVDSSKYPVHRNAGSSKNHLRNSASKMGANYVRLETVDTNHAITGTAYNCPI